jgi:hypothetical protein
MTTVSFDDLDSFDEEPTRPSKPGGIEWSNPCAKCQGTGRFVSYSGRDCGECFTCKGSGKVSFKTSPQQREKSRTQRVSSKENRRVENGKAFELAHPDEWAWLIKSAKTGFNFAISLLEAVFKFGDLTPNQLIAVQNGIARDAERNATRAATKDASKAIDVARIKQLFDNATKNRLPDSRKPPKLRFEKLTLSLAPPGGKNPGAIYVKRRDGVGTYLGKVVDGIYSPSYVATPDDVATVQSIAADPFAVATAYGIATKRCSCCGAELTNPESIRLGIGPICREKWGI